MLPFYQKHTYETVISPRRIPAFVSSVDAFSENVRGVVANTVQSLAGTRPKRQSRVDAVRQWMSRPSRDQFGIEIFLSEVESGCILALALRSIRTLSTNWGERHNDPRTAYLISSGFATDPDYASELAQWRDQLTHCLKEGFGLVNPPSIASISRINETYSTLREAADEPPDIPDVVSANFAYFRNPKVRSVLLRAKQARDPTIPNIAESAAMSPTEVRDVIAEGLGRGVFERQYDVECNHCDHVLARVESGDSITGVVDQNVSCPSCGREITQESYEKCYLVEDSAANALVGSKWMSMYMRRCLERLWGCERILTEVQHGPNEVDLVANIDGALMLMELKDDRFSMGHAYSFVGKCTQYNPDYAVIVASEGCDRDVKDYIDNLDLATVYIEDLSDIKKELTPLFSSNYANRLAEIVGQFNWEQEMARALLSQMGIQDEKQDVLLRALGGTRTLRSRRLNFGSESID